MSVKINKNGKEYDLGFMPKHYPADRVYLDGDTSKTVQELVARKSDLTNISQSGATATQAISSGTYFYLNGTLVRAKTDIANGATFTLNTNYEVVIAGGLNAINGLIKQQKIDYTLNNSDTSNYYIILDNNIMQTLGASKIVGMYVSAFSGIGLQSDKYIPNIMCDDGKMYTLFVKGKTFTGIVIQVTYSYME